MWFLVLGPSPDQLRRALEPFFRACWRFLPFLTFSERRQALCTKMFEPNPSGSPSGLVEVRIGLENPGKQMGFLFYGVNAVFYQNARLRS